MRAKDIERPEALFDKITVRSSGGAKLQRIKLCRDGASRVCCGCRPTTFFGVLPIIHTNRSYDSLSNASLAFVAPVARVSNAMKIV
jgi:hypothetical protein